MNNAWKRRRAPWVAWAALVPAAVLMGCSPGPAPSAIPRPAGAVLQSTAAEEDSQQDLDLAGNRIVVKARDADAPPAPDPLDQAIETLREDPPDGPAPAARIASNSGTAPARDSDVAALSEEVKSLRIEIQRLEQTLDEYLETVVKDLQQENDALRQEVTRLHGTGVLGEAAPGVPRPGSALIEEIIRETQAAAGPGAPTTEPGTPRAAGPDTFGSQGYEVVKEWGREADVAAQQGPSVASLKGMICAVPEGTSDEDLKALGRRLRKKFDGFVNINIEVFEGLEAAERFAKTGTGSSDQRVLSVSKYPATNRDVILLIRKGVSMEVPLAE